LVADILASGLRALVKAWLTQGWGVNNAGRRRGDGRPGRRKFRRILPKSVPVELLPLLAWRAWSS